MTCVLCKSDRESPTVNSVSRDGAQDMIACMRCGMCQQRVMPTAEEVRAYYASGEYRVAFPPVAVDGVEPGAVGYEAALEAAADAVASMTRELIGLRDGERIVEIGCGDGRMAARLGADVVEADAAMLAQALARPGVKAADAGPYTLLIACQVLEHQPDPIATLREWRAMLGPGGRAHLQVPSLERMYGGSSYFFQRPHLVAFTRRTLVASLLAAGFRVDAMGFDHAVLHCTATVGEPLPYDSQDTPGIDDVAGMIARHDAAYAEHVLRTTPGAVEVWLSGGPMPDEATVKHALTTLTALAAMGVDGVARLAHGYEWMCSRQDETWSASDWVRGYQSGTAAAYQRAQQDAAHLANAMQMRASK